MTDSLTVRRALRTDVDQLALMMEGLHRHLGLPPSPATPELLLSQLFGDRPLFACLVAEGPQGLCGYAAYCEHFNSDYMAPGLWLCDLYVDPGLRSLGAGRRLLAALARVAVDEGRVSIWWGVHRSNVRAVEFYDRIGAGDFQVALRELETEALRRLAAEAPPLVETAGDDLREVTDPM